MVRTHATARAKLPAAKHRLERSLSQVIVIICVSHLYHIAHDWKIFVSLVVSISFLARPKRPRQDSKVYCVRTRVNDPNIQSFDIFS